jgi:hypothetical protein
MDYKGGTYISQAEAADEQEAMIRWIENLETSQVKGFSKSDKRKIIELGFSDDDKAIQITGMQNVWYFNVRTKKGFAGINIVKTDKEHKSDFELV